MNTPGGRLTGRHEGRHGGNQTQESPNNPRNQGPASVNSTGARISQWLSDRLKQAERLLSPSRYSCIACSGSYTKRGELPLCHTCSASIPWILHVECECCGRPEICGDCSRRRETYFVQNRSAVSYNPLMKEWLGIFKYRGHEKLRALLGKMLLHAYHMHHRQTDPQSAAGSYVELLTYVPLSERRLAERGFNQAEQLTEELGRLTGIPVIGLLERVRHTDKQSFKTRGDRLADLQGVFALNPAVRSSLQMMAARKAVRLYVIDDVYTTGSTLSECAKVITMELDVAVYGISWAR
ncbi:ComF family protein [Paenibacillus sp. FSL H7-0331]|uniref:ComF family protein n=1 Tax=Paenibacillus sp. FSL H7-0331 TaxID=1920421 RepID=UPI002115FAC6|nr:ComF family protein [Paenibacillus sp. FSL H7-0331]